MEPTKIRINVSQASALAAGRTSYGPQVVTLSDADVAALSPEERDEILILKVNNYEEPKGARDTGVRTDSDGMAGVREALQFHRAERLEEAAKAALERAEMIARVLALPAERLINPALDLVSWCHGEIPWGAPELADRKTELEVLAKAKRAEKRSEIERHMAEMRATPGEWPDPAILRGGDLVRWTTQDEDREIRGREGEIAETRRRKEEAAEAAQRQAYRDWALTGAAGETARLAAAEGYDVRKAVIDALEGHLPEAAATDYDNPDYEWEERSSPSLAALKLRTSIVAAVEALQRPAWVKVEVSRVQRITEPDPADEYDDDGRPAKGGKHTGVVVTIDAPLTSNRYRFYYDE